ncbi:MopE-related protein [Haliscomenobacter hydrossis]|uniref:Ig family protein n=1 Tax=Haliscomenobacter hydrossis (strain ATCC 27775 / DSM 1100 / LMG 10767 / O) TaxID=760192 RepID=F4KZ04_HALH1|nr:MopE-related protein [Haliscomenobacter hydrossis]AEE52691.1 Ig family protein [Haliscomenobacter hydrossis DSM 1100]
MKKTYTDSLPALFVQLVKSPLFPKACSSFVVRTIQLLLLLALPLFSQGQAIDFDGTTTYTQDFQSITATALTAATTTNTTMLQVSAQAGGGAGTNGWYMYQQTGTARWGRSNGGANTGSFYGMYDAASSPNRAFGSTAAASSVGSFGVVLKNTSGARINEIVITYDAMINRNPSTTANAYPMSYRVSSSNIAGASSTGDGTYNDAAGTWITGTGFITPISGTGAPATQAAITPLFRIGGTAITQTLSNLSWNTNEYLYIRWKDTDESGGDAMAGIDNFSLTKVPFAITGQPSDQYDCTSNTASFSVTATGVSSYQWFRSSDNGANWVPLGNGDYGLISGVTTATLVASGGSLAPLNGTLFRCAVSDGSSTINSQPARFTQGLPTTSIQYSETAYCTSANSVAVAITGARGGTFSASPAGLMINTSTGQITPASSTPNTYTILYSVPAQHGCAATSASTTVIITSNTSPTISYGTAPLCFDVTAVPVTLNGAAGGTFTAAPAGLTINSTTGAINPAASTAGEYTVTYVTNGSSASGCAAYTTTTTVTTYTHLNAVITGGGNHVCAGGSYTLTVTGTPNSIVTYKINDGIDLFLTLDNTGTTTLNTGPLRDNTSYKLVAMRFADTLLCARTLNSTANLTFDRPYLTYAVAAPASACVGDVVNIEISNRPFTIILYQINGGLVQTALINNNAGLISIPVTVNETISFTRFSSVYQGAPNCSTTYPDSAAIVIVAEPSQVWYKDADNDGYAETGAPTLTQCLRPAGYKVVTELLASSGDCDDNNAAINPDATEINDGIDNNCDGIGDACSDLNAPDPVIIVNSTCSACALSGGSISAPASSCPVGSTLQYKVDNGPWTSTLPTYNQTTTQTIKTRCSCDGNPSIVSDSSAIATTPGVCTPPDATITVTESAGPGGLNDAVTCSGNPVILSASGVGTYRWSTLATASSITVSPGGSSVTYTVTVTAANGCTGTDDQVLTILPNPTGAITVTENSGTPNDGTVCSGTQVTLAAPGGFSYSWSTNLATTSSVTITPSSSTYRVSVTDNNNCRSVFIKPIVVLNNPNVSENLTHPTCANLSGGAIDLTVSSGTAPYTFTWSDGPSTTEDRTDLSAGMYSVTVTDASGCTISASYTLNTPSSCCPDLSGPAPANVTIVNSTCTVGGTPSGGSITAPGGTPCPTGSTLQYQVNGGSWSSILPVYDQEGPAQSIKTRCSCDAVPATVSAESEAVSTAPVALSPFYADVDSDGFGDPLSSVNSYCQPFGYVVDNTDCDDLDVLEKPGQIWYADVDNDGYSSGTTLTQCLRPVGYKAASELTAPNGDCNDNNFAIKPSATEICDGIDNNCDGTTDEGGLITYYADADQDGFGNPSVSQQACSPPSGYVSNNTDCDDNDALEKPGQIWYADVDNDGYSSGTTLTQCLRPVGYKAASELTAPSGDCNDNNFAIKPSATEICDGIDNNCDGTTDEGLLITYYADADNDGFGNPSVSQQACSPPSGYVSNNTDCDDNDALEKPGQIWYADVDNDGYSSGTTLTQCLRPVGYKAASELTAPNGDCNDNNFAIKPSATEICDGIDNNCDGTTDEGLLITYYADADNDGFGNPSVSQQACSPPSGYVSNNTDCDDNDVLEKPGQIWYADVDNDGYSSGTTLTQCLRPVGYKAASELTAPNGDCNDNNFAIKPSATEICDGIDNNCDGTTDEGGLITYYADADQDGFGDPSVSQQACSPPSGYVSNNTDCDDNDALEKPGQIWYADVDNDGYSSGTTLTQCLRPVGYKAASELTAPSGDCNDNNPAVKPGATEICDGIDNNCDGTTDEGGLITYYADADQDGFGDPSVSQQACSPPSGYVTNNTDCDDNDALEKPGQIWYADVDNDGYSSGTTLTQCLRPVGYKAASELTAPSGDCNDNNPAVKPGATEICDGIDNNCNGSTDEGGSTRYYYDLDGDGYGEAVAFIDACAPSGLYTATVAGDCIANDADINPGATEICDGKDNDCNGQIDEGLSTRYYYDLDGDGYGEAVAFIDACTPSGLYTATVAGDCIADDADIYPGATEICDGKDNDCNGQIDEGVSTRYYYDNDGDGYGQSIAFVDACAPSGFYTALLGGDCNDSNPLEKPGQVWYADADNDGYSSGTTLTQCLRPVGYKAASELTAPNGDCNDNNFAIKPSATEICDGIDNNCNGSTDEGVLTTYYADIDNDGFGNPAVSQQACSPPSGYVTNNTDCDDNDALEKPGQIWYADVDNDGYSSGTTLTQCLRPVGYKVASELTAPNGDCNDNNFAIKPSATEICDGEDNNCDGVTDEGCTPPMVSIHDPCSCAKNAPIIDNGTTTDLGTFSETVTVEGPSGQTWTIVTVTGLYSDIDATIAYAPGATIPETGVGTGIFELGGYHRDGVGYTISVTNGQGDTLSIDNTCYYPDPVFTGLPAVVSPAAAPFQVTGTVANNATGTGTFILDGVPQPGASAAPTVITINPGRLSPGNHTLVYSFDADTATSNNLSDPGCVQEVQQRFQIAHCGCQDVTVTLDANCQFLLTANLISDGNCNGGTVRVMDNSPGNGGLIDCAGVWTYGLFDAFGNIICWGKVTAEDKTAPALICPPADITLDCYDVNYVLNERRTIGNVGDDLRSPRPAANATDGRTINNAEGVAGTGDECDLGLNPPGLVDDNYKNLGYAYYRDNCYNCGCRTTLKWTDKVVFYACTDIEFTRDGYYAKIEREWVATDCNGMRADAYIQDIFFTRPDLDDFVFSIGKPDDRPVKGQTGVAAGTPGYDWVVEYQSCTPDKSLILHDDVTPYDTSYFHTSNSYRLIYLDKLECNYSVSIKDTEFPICGGKGVKIDRALYVFDWCAGKIVDTFHILIKIGDFQAPTATYAHHAPYVISTGPMDCTAAFPIGVAGIKSAFGVEIKDNCSLTNVSVSVYTKDRYVKGILVYEGPSTPWCITPQANGAEQRDAQSDCCIRWEKVDYAIMNGNMIGVPVGRHVMKIEAFDGCYNSSTLCFEFEVKDKIAPVMKCDDDLHISLSNANGYVDGYAQVTAADIDEGSWDNCKLAWIAVRRNVPTSCTASFIQKGYDSNGNGKIDAAPFDDPKDAPANWKWIVDGKEVVDGIDNNGDGDIFDRGEFFATKGGKIMTPLQDAVDFFCCDLAERVTIELWGADNADNPETENIDESNWNYCWNDVLIEDKVAPTCVAPWDITVDCDAKCLAQIDDARASTLCFGDVSITSGSDCANLDTVYTVTKNLKCGYGKIVRSWTLTKETAKGPISITCSQTIWVRPIHEYDICFPKDVSSDCKTPIIDTVLTDELACDILAVNVADKRYDASDDECYKIFRTYTVINWCAYDDRCGDPMAEGSVYVVERSLWENYGKAPIYLLVRDRDRDLNEEFWLSKDLTPNNGDDIYVRGDSNLGGVTRGRDVTISSGLMPFCKPEIYAHPNDYFQDWEYHHSFMYTQIIKVYDEEAPVVTGIRDTFCTSPTACTANITKVVTIKDNCTDVVELERQQLMIAPNRTTNAGSMILYSTPRWSVKELGNGQFEITVANLPEGTHDLIVVGRDECGNLSAATRIPFTVKDCKAPAPICINGLSTELMPNGSGKGMMTVWANDFVASEIYDCNGQGPETKDGLKLVKKYSINRVGQPVDQNKTALELDCEDAGENILVEIHAWDQAGNHDFCITFIEVQDNRKVCPTVTPVNKIKIAGTISTEMVANLQGVTVTLSGQSSMSATTNAAGDYSFVNLTQGGDFTVTPQLDKNHLNGVSTFDLVLIQKHILGVQALNSPYKLIAADANNSKSISTLDMIQIRKLILNIDQSFANNTSWRFVDATYRFPNPANPWSGNIPEVVSMNDLATNITANFVAIKVGDVNASAVVNATTAEVRTSGAFKLQTTEQELKAGNEYRVAFTAEDLQNVQGYQFALNLDQNKVELLDIEYGVAKAENFGVFKNEGLITTSWNSKYEPGTLFTLVLRAKADAKLSQSINLNRTVSPEAYDQNNENLGIALHFEGIPVSEVYELLQNTPNPFSDETVIGFKLPKATAATLSIRDVKGALLYQVEGNYAKGNNQVILKEEQLGASGILYYTLATEEFTATKKMVILRK